MAKERDITVAEVTYSNSISVAEHAVMQILTLVRNFVPSHRWAVDGGWNIADCVERAYDLEGMDVGVIAAGRIGEAKARPVDAQGAKAAGLEGLTPHALRHSFITNMLDAQVPVHTTAALAGHSRPAVTLDTYSHLVSDEARAAMAAMDARKPKAQQHQIELARVQPLERLGDVLGVAKVSAPEVAREHDLVRLHGRLAGEPPAVGPLAFGRKALP